jgi:putative radical SAM enzyme (TIGR03279 family)
MRRTLYVRDEDYRFSFLFGHFITLTNLSEADFRRIIEMRLSPLYVSVHSTNAGTRARLLRRTKGVDVLPPLRRLAGAGVTVQAQVVVCPGINDGADLDATLEDLAGLHPAVRSVAIVPVGLTSHRAGLASLEPATAAFARNLIPVIEAHRRRFRDRMGTGFAYLADEWFRILDLDPPGREYYDDFPLLENGVGMIRRFLDEVEEDGERLFGDIRATGARRVTCVTGRLFAPVLERVMRTAGCVPRGVAFDVLPVENRFYGPSVRVAGLLVGGDIRDALRGAVVGDLICVPAAALNGRGLFLDDVSIDDLRRDQGREVFADLSPFEEEAGCPPRHSLHGA